ncbi:MAG: tRNA (N6-threonylcarbamoyladenosine(37)-N6)-methyltransferase TrmO [Proteiniphilum sp.]|jgi:tRNA-Thr(GGU) m(6)t(6)A37 methyltransferase TsaA|nr:tRNA (N6-threonylcarbamoyladenosine(37)-N6)-methyltransferase TrmO [Proteiniphilum sp.]NCB24825.1 tRNA (N6-threonylcarbamoyladenosine(37)-N6)-methyltransferase TrmO [Bacteroidia bacterium]MDD2937194.1 tRNA (N6-threonylcarbamoyladenosine(37)-N6)-methyltransferase TrmO [Proteiniphilum sp.]MDD3076584.1 tRNA (N6-threonylcarbamoyladenosine(37)-N6)-methyltransferase TrmO [Proteiniphilum sp.]MDD3780907.1 tRNA (N6-threonylcarbamoyladenosine(37)-N6)-methyltransferase TrmO [Proteiniphilum sp.]
MKTIAYIHTDFTTKFGIPRQSGLVDSLKGQIVFEPPYRNIEALRGLEGFSHIWLIWEFSETKRDGWSPLVRPPRLGGNKRLGVFATRSPFRPNPIGLSSVRLERIEWQTPQGPVLHVLGADMMNGTPIFDIKPYLTYADSHPAAVNGFTEPIEEERLQVVLPEVVLSDIPYALRTPLKEILANDPRPSYQDDPERVYGIKFAGMDIQFIVDGDELTVVEVKKK